MQCLKNLHYLWVDIKKGDVKHPASKWPHGQHRPPTVKLYEIMPPKRKYYFSGPALGLGKTRQDLGFKYDALSKAFSTGCSTDLPRIFSEEQHSNSSILNV